MQVARKLETHYFLQNASHSIDAIVRNNCEAEFLDIAYEIIRLFELEIRLEAEPHEEGGFKDIWKFIGDNGIQLTFIVAVLTLLMTLKPSTDEELTSLQKEETKLSIEEKKLNIEKLKKELSSGASTESVVQSAAVIASKANKVAVHKSNFYKQLSHYPKVTQVGFSKLDENNNSIAPEAIIPRDDFQKFILLSNKLRVEIIKDAPIEIVAPVLRAGTAKWKGIYAGFPISFEMNDKIFKKAVISKQISFKNGDIIICVLEIHRELNEVGEVIIKNYSVPTVLDKIDNGVRKETESGKNFRREKALKKAQGSLDL